MPEEGEIRPCAHLDSEDSEDGRRCTGMQSFSRQTKPPKWYTGNEPLCAGWMCQLNREHFDLASPDEKAT
jgi:hypothetical protein